jgi:hypothetical protein
MVVIKAIIEKFQLKELIVYTIRCSIENNTNF